MLAALLQYLKGIVRTDPELNKLLRLDGEKSILQIVEIGKDLPPELVHIAFSANRPAAGGSARQSPRPQSRRSPRTSAHRPGKPGFCVHIEVLSVNCVGQLYSPHWVTKVTVSTIFLLRIEDLLHVRSKDL